MSLMRRIMWPRVGEQVTITQNGRVIVAGHVTYSGNDEVRILDQEADTVVIDATELTTGIENRSITVTKMARAH